MINFISRFKIPTLLGLSIILLGLVSGVYLVLKEQILLSQAAPNLTPQNLTFSNISDNSVVISWQTNSATPAFITFGQNNPEEQTTSDDRDANRPVPRLIHYVTLKNLLPQTRYQFKIIAGKFTSEVKDFETAKSSTSSTNFSPVIGSVLNDNTPLNDGIVYLAIADAITQSALIKNGNFLIPLSAIRQTNLTDLYNLTEETTAKISVVSDQGNANLLLKLKSSSSPLAPLKLGQNIDLVTNEEAPQPKATPDLNKYDLNSDGKINAADNAIILQNFGKNPKNKKADINSDGKVDQTDLQLMSEELKKQEGQ